MLHRHHITSTILTRIRDTSGFVLKFCFALKNIMGCEEGISSRLAAPFHTGIPSCTIYLANARPEITNKTFSRLA